MHAIALDTVAFLLVFALLFGLLVGTHLPGLARRWYQHYFRPIPLRALPDEVRQDLRQ